MSQLNQEIQRAKPIKENPMREIKIEKIILSCSGVDVELQKSKKLLELISGKKAQIIASKKRIPEFGVRPGLEVGTRVTLRGPEAIEVLKRLLGAVDNVLSILSVSQNTFSFGIKEYIDIPDIAYQRDLGIRGLNVTVTFTRPGARVVRKKIKQGRLPKRFMISEDEIMEFMKLNFKSKFRR